MPLASLADMPAPDRAKRVKRVSILGSTGSIGCNTVDLLERNRPAYDVVALTANRDVPSLARQARALQAEVAVIADDSLYPALKEALAGSSVEAAAGVNALNEAAARPCDWLMAAIIGYAGLGPTLSAIRQGHVVALANKESLVCAGDLFINEARRHGARLLPVDSEHNAIYQVMDFDHPERIAKITLTASGGPFRTLRREEMARVTPEQAVAHPNWRMGAKISVDSATMMNKGLEVIEAYHLFPVKADQLDVLVHPQSVIHSMVSYVDGSVLAQLGSPDMRTPIAYTLAWPDRMETPAERLDLAKLGQLTFEAPDEDRFPALALARRALHEGGSVPVVLNAANEEAVAAFLAGDIGFLNIAEIVARSLDAFSPHVPASLEEVEEIDAQARRVAQGFITAGK